MVHYVRERRSSGGHSGTTCSGAITWPVRTGVLQSIDLKSGMAVVRWVQFEVTGDQVRLGGECENVGIEGLEFNRELYGGSSSARLGDIVFRYQCASDSDDESGQTSTDLEEPWVGYIHGFTINGEVEVCWDDGLVSIVNPLASKGKFRVESSLGRLFAKDYRVMALLDHGQEVPLGVEDKRKRPCYGRAIDEITRNKEVEEEGIPSIADIMRDISMEK